MVELDNMKMELAGYKEPLKEVKASLGLTAKLQRIEEYKREMEAPGFWDDPEASNTKVKELRSMESVVETITDLETRYEDIETLIERGYEESDESLIPEIREELDTFISSLENIRISTLL